MKSRVEKICVNDEGTEQRTRDGDGADELAMESWA